MVLRRSRSAIKVVFRADGGELGKGRIVRLSSDGLYIRTPRPPKPRQRIVFTVVDAQDELEIEGVVRWIRTKGDDAGFYCAMTSPSKQYHALFESLLVS